MRIKQFVVKGGYRSLKDVSINFDDITVLVGTNDSGKSNVLKALGTFFLSAESQDIQEVKDIDGGGGGNPFSYDLAIKNNDLFFDKIPTEIELSALLDLSTAELDLLFPLESYISPDETSTILKEDLKSPIQVSRRIFRRDNSVHIKTSQIRIDSCDLEILRIEKDKIKWLGRKESVLLYGRGSNLTEMLFRIIANSFSLIPSDRRLRREKRSRQTYSKDGDNIPSAYLSYEKDASIEKDQIFEEIKGDTINIFPNVRNVTSKEYGEEIVDVHFGKFKSSAVGSGIQQVFVSIFDILSTENRIVALEEPEIHLHPSKQREFLEYLQQKSKDRQIILTTHSPVIAGNLNLRNVNLVKLSNSGETTVEPLTDDNVEEVIDELGIKPSDIFNDDVIVFVEGTDDVSIFTAWRKLLQPSSKIGFFDSGGWTKMEYFANAAILKSESVQIPSFFIFDGDTKKTERNETIKKKLVEEAAIDKTHFITLNLNSIENYILVPSAINKAFPTIPLKKVADFLEKNITKRNKKTVLDSLLKSNKLGKYDAEKAKKIASNMTKQEIDKEIHMIFKQL